MQKLLDQLEAVGFGKDDEEPQILIDAEKSDLLDVPRVCLQ